MLARYVTGSASAMGQRNDINLDNKYIVLDTSGMPDDLLLHCRYQAADWLSDTIRRLLDEYAAGGNELPYFKQAMLVIDEHCGVKGRHIFDQDNKSIRW